MASAQTPPGALPHLEGRAVEGGWAIGLATAAFGTGPVVANLVAAPAFTIVLLRFVLAAALMGVALAVARRPVTMLDVRRSVPGGLLLTAQVIVLVMAVRHTSVADATFIMSLQPMLVLLVAPRMFGERRSWRLAAYAALGIGGVALVVYSSSRVGIAHGTGELLAVLNVLMWTAYLLSSKLARRDGRVEALQYQACVNTVGAVALLVLAPVIGARLTGLGGDDWLAIAYLTLVGTAAHVLVNWAQRYVDLSVASLILLAQPVVATFGAAVMLDQRIAPVGIVGGGCVLFAAGAAGRQHAR
jgi:drug/metabolite transporter (DMT)-like permease